MFQMSCTSIMLYVLAVKMSVNFKTSCYIAVQISCISHNLKFQMLYVLTVKMLLKFHDFMLAVNSISIQNLKFQTFMYWLISVFELQNLNINLVSFILSGLYWYCQKKMSKKAATRPTTICRICNKPTTY